MRFCMECGEKLNDDQLFCPNCGTKVAVEDAIMKDQSAPTRDQYSDGKDQYARVNPLTPDETIQLDEAPDEAIRFDEEPETTTAKKNHKLWVGLGIGAGVLVVGAVILVLVLTGAFKSKSLKPSKEKLITLEDAFLSDAWNQAESLASAVKEASFDADVTFDIEEDSYSSSGFSTASLMDSLSVHLSKDARKGQDIGVQVLYYFNPVLDLRLFDLDQDDILLYCSPGSNDLYRINLQQFLTQMLSSEYESSNVSSMLVQLLLSDQSGKLLEQDYKEVQKVLLGLFEASEVDIEAEETIELFDDEEETCELYTVQPTASELEDALTELFDYLEKGDGFFPRILKLEGVSGADFSTSRKNIPELAKQLHDMHLTFEIGVQENTIIHQKISVDSLYFGYDTIEKKSALHTRIFFHMNNRSGSSFSGTSFELDRVKDSKGKVVLEMNAADMIRINGSYDLNEKSEIGTYAGQIDITAYGRNVATVTIEPSKNGMLHRIELNPDLLNMRGVDRFVIKADVKSVTGVDKPSGAEITDTSMYSREDWLTLMNKLFVPIMYAFR